jgi:nucleotide-binding universal stress UspA family protein
MFSANCKEVAVTTLAPTTVAFERILIPTDFSDISNQAVEYAKSIARHYDSQLLLVHVNQPINLVAPPEAVWIDEEEIRQQREQWLEHGREELRAQGFKAEALFVTGTIHEELRSIIKEHKIDLILMGTHGKSGLDRFLLGSDTEAVLRRVNCPVLVIGPSALPAENGEWRLKHVICATTLDPDAVGIAACAYKLAHEHQAELMLLNVENPARVSTGEEDWLRFESALRQCLPDDIQPSDALRTRLLDSVPGHKIVDVAKERHADLIVMGARAASGITAHLLRGTVPQVIAEAPCPVLTLHQQ